MCSSFALTKGPNKQMLQCSTLHATKSHVTKSHSFDHPISCYIIKHATRINVFINVTYSMLQI